MGDIMSQTPSSNAWTPAEREAVKQVFRYAVAIFSAIALTLLIVAIVSSAFMPVVDADTATNMSLEGTPLVTEQPK
jgi:hypothetical protein